MSTSIHNGRPKAIGRIGLNSSAITMAATAILSLRPYQCSAAAVGAIQLPG